MKPLIIIATLALATAALAAPATKVTNRKSEDGSGGSSKLLDPEKRQSVETVFAGGKVSYKIVYALDDHLQPVSGIYYNNAGRVFQKSAYKLDGLNRIVQEVVYTAQDKLVCTKNYIYGTRAGKDKVVGIDTYDANGNLIRPAPKAGRRR